MAVLFSWWCILQFIWCIWKGNSAQISCVGDSRSRAVSTHCFITEKCDLLWEGVSVTQAVSIWTAIILCGYHFISVFSVRKLLLSITRCVPSPADAEPRAPQPSLRSLLHWRSHFINCFWQQNDFFFFCQCNSLKQSVIRDKVTGGSWWSLSRESAVWNPLEMQETLTWQFGGFGFLHWKELRMGLDPTALGSGRSWVSSERLWCDLGLVKLLGYGLGGASKLCWGTHKFYL